jgi:hypothetical protein
MVKNAVRDIPKFNPASLSQKDLEAAVEFYLGINVKYLAIGEMEIKTDPWLLAHDGVSFYGFKPYMKLAGRELPV